MQKDNFNHLAICYKPPNITSQSFATRIKKKMQENGYKIDKIGFSGILDPFAKGSLILAFNRATRLLSHINTSFKTYRATIFLGLNSLSLDSSNITSFTKQERLKLEDILLALSSLKGEISYTPPSFSAKKIDGIRAYKMARERKEVKLEQITSFIKDISFSAYMHPFLSFDIEISKGGYIRSIAKILCERLSTKGALCYLERIKEGDISYKNLSSELKEIHLKDVDVNFDIRVRLLKLENIISYDTIILKKYCSVALDGKKLTLKDENIPDGTYLADFGLIYAIIKKQGSDVKYILNRIDKC